MKAKEVLKLLGITRVTLWSYAKKNIIKTTTLQNGYYDYDEDDVFKLIKKEQRNNVIYARVSTYKQKKDLDNQIKVLTTYCNDNNIFYDSIYKEIASGIDLDRKEISKLIDDVMHHKIKNIYITNKDRLTRLSFITLETIFSKFGTNIIAINDIGKNKSGDQELFEELMSLIHIFSTKTYSHRRKKKLNIIRSDLQLFN